MPEKETVEEGIKRRRYVRGRCSECGSPSPVIDQENDPRRSEVARWFEVHVREIHPGPWVEWELAKAPDEGQDDRHAE